MVNGPKPYHLWHLQIRWLPTSPYTSMWLCTLHFHQRLINFIEKVKCLTVTPWSVTESPHVQTSVSSSAKNRVTEPIGPQHASTVSLPICQLQLRSTVTCLLSKSSKLSQPIENPGREKFGVSLPLSMYIVLLHFIIDGLSMKLNFLGENFIMAFYDR